MIKVPNVQVTVQINFTLLAWYQENKINVNAQMVINGTQLLKDVKKNVVQY